MAAQQAPHTPLWRKLLSQPQTRLGWWAVGLVGIYWILGATVDFADGLWVLGTKVASWESVVYWPALSAYSLVGVVGTVVALVALLASHERSALVWLAMVAGLPAFIEAGWIALVGGYEQGGSLPVIIALAVLIGVLIAWLRRHNSGEPR